MTDFSLSPIFSGLLSGDGGTALLVAALAIAILMGLVLAASAGYFRVILNIAVFARPDARVRAIGNPMVEWATVSVVREAHSLHDLFDRFRAAGYAFPSVGEMNIEIAEQTIRGYYYGRVVSLTENVPDSVSHFFAAYRDMLAAREAAWIILSMGGDVSPADIERQVSSVGSLTPEMIRTAVHAAGPEDALSRFAPAPFGPVLAAAYREAAGDHAQFFALVQIALLENISLAAQSVDISLSPPVTEVAGRMIDIANIRSLARSLSVGAGKESVARYLILEGGFELSGDRLNHAIRAGSLPDLIQALVGTTYEPYLSRHPDAVKDEDIPVLEAALDLCMLDVVRAVSNQYHLESGPLLRYLVTLGYEAQNMQAIAVGIAESLPPEEIGRVLVTEEVKE
ncbi:V-type ATPase subunit [Methanogenium organophilum]|uniref:V-type ATPase subunit n=1 Tax=Methanogenium organophilum TaxID=2199 RepID=A0A9X9T8G0_METOG|nr:V-type ATPase subunit [Methanogenium organophilum]WAI01660.1 V-type ATPase subunit [Methanogenium organophilum]